MNKLVNDIKEEMQCIIDNMEDISEESSEYEIVVGNLERLKDIYIDLIKTQYSVINECDQKRNNKREYIINQTIGVLKFAVDTGVKIGSIMFAAKMYDKWWNEGMKFEESGCFTSTTFKSLTKRFSPFCLFN